MMWVLFKKNLGDVNVITLDVGIAQFILIFVNLRQINVTYSYGPI